MVPTVYHSFSLFSSFGTLTTFLLRSELSRLKQPCDSGAINICFFNAAQEQSETSSKEETKWIIYMQGLVGANLLGEKSANNKKYLKCGDEE